MRSMNVLDAGLLAMESPATPMHIGGVQILRPPKGAGRSYVRELRDRVRGIQPTSAPFNYRLAPRKGPLGLPAWEELKNVDMSQHVQHHALPWPGGQDELMALISRLNLPLLDRSRPMWEYHLIEGLEGGRFAAFTRIHHAMIDGEWGMRLMHQTTSDDPLVRDLPPYWAVKFAKSPRRDALTAKEHGGWWQRKTALGDEIVKTGAQLRRAIRRVFESYWRPTDAGLPMLYSAPDCILNGPLTPRREMAVVELDLGRVKALANANDATVNEIMLALCGASLREYLLARHALPDKPLIANIPVALARPEGESGGNAIGSAFISLATHLADPVKRFEAIRGSSQQAKQLIHDLSPMALTIYGVTTGLPFIVAQALGHVEKVHTQTLVISNVPGPREKRYVNGALIEAEYPLALLVPGQAMNITVIGLADRLDAAVLVCPDLAPDPQRVTRGLKRALDELEVALRRARTGPAKEAGRRVPRRGRPAGRTGSGKKSIGAAKSSRTRASGKHVA